MVVSLTSELRIIALATRLLQDDDICRSGSKIEMQYATPTCDVANLLSLTLTAMTLRKEINTATHVTMRRDSHATLTAVVRARSFLRYEHARC